MQQKHTVSQDQKGYSNA